MKSIGRNISDNAPSNVKRFTDLYINLEVRISTLVEAYLTTSEPIPNSEIDKWIKGEFDYSLRSIVKLEIELGEELINITKPH